MAKDEKGITVSKEENFSEWYSQVVQKAELADIRYGIQGFIVHRPWGFMIIKRIYEMLEKEFEQHNHVPYLFPMAVKEEWLTKEKEHAGFTPEVFWVTEAGSKKLEERFALRPTGEAQIYPMYALWLRSHKELPFKAYQSRIPAFRNEMTTRPFLRGREFCFFESHNVFNTHKEALEQIKEDLHICKLVLGDKLKIPFLYFKRPVWDTFKGADDTFTPDTVMPDGKRNQLASTHDLGQNFAKAYDIKVKDQQEKESFVWQTCFGPGIWRITAALIGIHGDDQGLVLPFDIAPIQVVIIPVVMKGKEDLILKEAKAIESLLKQEGVRVHADLREMSPGAKYNEWELKGVPLRLELGPKEIEQKQFTLVTRTQKKKETISAKAVVGEIRKRREQIDNDIEERSKKYFEHNTREANSLSELKQVIEEHKGFVNVAWCSVEKDGESCAAKLKEETNGAYVCGTLYPEEKKVKKTEKCIICNEKAKHKVYVAKSY